MSRNIKGARHLEVESMKGEFSGNMVKLIRAEITRCKKAGTLDKRYKTSVVNDRGGMSYSFTININSVPDDATEESVKEIRKQLGEIGNLWNSDTSDVDRDYFEVGYYLTVNPAYKYK